MAPPFRRSLSRRSGLRSIAVVVVLALAGHGGLDAPATGAPRLAPTDAAGPTLTVASKAGVHQAAEFAGFDPTASTQDPTDAGDAAAPAAGLQPSIQFEEAERHAADKTSFTPGERVTIGFQPQAGDPWTVGDVPATGLPAGRLDGATIRRQGRLDGIHGMSRPGGSPRPTVTAMRPGRSLLPSTDEGTSIDLPSGGGSPLAATIATFRAEPDGISTVPQAAISPNGLRREIFGFLPYWEVNSSSLRLDYRKLSTIAYFGVGADAAGNLQKRNTDGSTTVGWSGWTSAKMTSIISTAHRNHTRVVLTVQSFAWNTSGLARQRALLGSSSARRNLARQIAAAVRDRGADGVNLDFEPLASGADIQFTALIRSIRTELNRIHRGYQITFDTTGSIGNYPIAAATAPGGADAVFIMGYDYRTGGSSPVGSVAPLDGNGTDIRDTIQAYLARVPASKLILGVPYYGRAWSTNSNLVHATNTSSTRTGASTTVDYDTAAGYLAQYGRHYDAREQVAWTAYRRQNCTSTGCVTSWRQLYVDDAVALQAKYDLVNTYRLRGAGIWALGYDGARPELWAAIQRKFVTDTTPPSAGVPTLPARQVNPTFIVRWIGSDDVGVASYDVQSSTDGGVWRAWINGTKATAATWIGLDGHDYAFRVRARDPRGNTSAWNVASTTAAPGSALTVGGFGVVRIDGLSIRAAADTSARKLGTYSSGDLVAIVGGPRTADGYTWYRVVGPLTEWTSVRPLASPAWVAARGAGATWLSPAKTPSSTRVIAALGDLAFGNAGPASIGASPSATAHRAFSPNGDGAGDSLAIGWTNDRALDNLVLRVFRADGSLVGNVALAQRAKGAQRVAWNGVVGTTKLPNGWYLVTLVGSAGRLTLSNPGPSFAASSLAALGVRLDTVAPAISRATISDVMLSPNRDGIHDSLGVAMAASGADGWTFSVARLGGGAPVIARSGRGAHISLDWDGRTAAGTVVPEGWYRLTLAAVDDAGNRTARSWAVRVDTTAPTATAVASPVRFSPNGDGAADTTRLTWTASERITGTARIYRGTTLIRSWAIPTIAAGSIQWTGTSTAGSAVPDGTYTFRIAGRDAAGNATTRVIPVIVDRTVSTLRWNRASFYPQDGDALTPSARLTFSLKRQAAVTVGIYSGSSLVRTVWTNRTLAAGTYGWTWNGRTAAGGAVQPGMYAVRVTATSALGTTVLARSVAVDAFDTSLSATTLRAGQTLTVTLTTTEPLRASPSIAFTQPGRATVVRTATSLGSGRYRVAFTVASGSAGAATIRISGRDTAGGLNTTTRTLSVR